MQNQACRGAHTPPTPSRDVPPTGTATIGGTPRPARRGHLRCAQGAASGSQRSHHPEAPWTHAAPPPWNMDSPIAGEFERGTTHLERPAGERDPCTPGTPGSRPPTSWSCSLATVQPGRWAQGTRGRRQGRGGGGRRGSFFPRARSRVPPPEVAH